MALHPFLLLILLPFSSTTITTIVAAIATVPVTIAPSSISHNPFTPKSSFLRYYRRKVPRGGPLPSFLLSKLSPLSASSAASLSSLLISSSPLPPSFCSFAILLCPLPSSSSLSSSNLVADGFSSYTNTNFTNYGTSRSSGADSFRQYSPDTNLPNDSFRRYATSSSSRNDSFSTYGPDGNVVSTSFTSYATSATSGSGTFSTYALNANVPNVKFTNYDAGAVGRNRSFTSYSDTTNSGDQSFVGYGKHGDGVPTGFDSYATNSNVLGSNFNGYGEDGNSAADHFMSYGRDGNKPVNTFKAYGENGNGGEEKFTAYRDRANTGDDSFQSYAKHGNAAKAEFKNYGRSFNPGTDTFKGYGEGPTANHEIGFSSYSGENTTFAAYAKTGISFATYRNSTSVPVPPTDTFGSKWVEPGKFFRERCLKEGTVMVMADIRDRMPKRAFLPRSITKTSLPLDAVKVNRIFQLKNDSGLGKAVVDTAAECERAPSKGETKQCVASAEDMIDFAVSVLGNNVLVRSTDNVRGSGVKVLIGNVKGINGGNITKSVSCHQSLFPYLVYYCHSVPKVRVYTAEILDAANRKKINRGVAVCHLDTSDWSPGHGAFAALGSKPGGIEVCHWIFEGDMTWTVAASESST